MYNNVYQEYINNIIGIVPRIQPDFKYNTYSNINYFQERGDTNNELERLYPELYKLLYPMIQTACMRNTKPITEETIDEMVKDIYSNFNVDDVTILNINLTNDVRSNGKTNEISKSSNIKSTSKTVAENRNNEVNEERNLRSSNYVLNDLIRILLIRELLERPGDIPPFRPGFPGQGRPPFRPRDIGYDRQNYDIYEHLNF